MSEMGVSPGDVKNLVTNRASLFKDKWKIKVPRFSKIRASDTVGIVMVFKISTFSVTVVFTRVGFVE